MSSVWSPGSPFAPITFLTESNHSHILGSSHDQVHTVLQQEEDQLQQHYSVLGKDYGVDSLTSVTLLLIGIISGRFGLWIADLSVQQIFQENVAEEERGEQGKLLKLEINKPVFRCPLWRTDRPAEWDGPSEVSLGDWSSSSTHFWYSHHCIIRGKVRNIVNSLYQTLV